MFYRIFKKLRHFYEYHTYLKKKLESQLKHINIEGVILKYLNKKVLLTILETNHYQHNHILGIAKALQIRGADIKVLVCNEKFTACEIKSVLNKADKDPCFYCRFNLKNVVSKFGFEIIDPSEVLSNEEISKIKSSEYKFGLSENDISLDQCINDSVVRYYFGNIPYNETEKEQIRQENYHTALSISKVCKKIDTDWKPDIVIGNMAAYSAWEPIYKYFQKYGNRFRLISLQAFNFKTITLNQFDLFGNLKRFYKYKQLRPTNYFLNIYEQEQLSFFLKNRRKGTSNTTTKDFFNFQDSNNIKLTFDKEKRNIFLFSNIYWDIGLSERPGLFNDVKSWVLETIELLKDNNDIHLYVRPHPGEVFGSQKSLKGISEIIKENYTELPLNLTIIEPEWKLNTYDLFDKIDLGLIFTGTLGLEMMFYDIPVISTGTCTHSGLGFSAEPKTLNEYYDYLLGTKALPKYEKRDLELFLYFYFIKANIPWTLTSNVYGEKFNGFQFKDIKDIIPGKDVYLDHLCESIMNYDTHSPECW